MRFLALAFVLLTLGATLPAAESLEPGFKSLFNGRDLAGWEGLPAFWSVSDGAITGRTTAETPLKANTFLLWKGGEVKDFELRCSFRLTAQNEKNFANSGIQYRSRIIDAAAFVLGGYQADLDFAGKYVGMLYEEKGRGILMLPGQTIRIDPLQEGKKKAPVAIMATTLTPEALRAVYRAGDWNEMVIIGRGNRLQHFLNGKLTADVTDNDPAKCAAAGVLGLQLHVGLPMTVQFKNVRLKTLP